MKNENEQYQPNHRVTDLFEAALRGDGLAQGELFRLVENDARRLAFRWLRRFGGHDRVRVTELIGEAFLRLVPPIPKHLRLLIDALGETEGVDQALQGTGGQPERVYEIVDNILRREELVDSIRKLGIEPSEFRRDVATALKKENAAQQLQASRGEPQEIRRVIAKLAVELTESLAGSGRTPWPHRGAFYAYMCRVMMQVLIDAFRQLHRSRDSRAIPDILLHAVGGSEDVLRRLGDTGGEPDKIGGMLSEIIWGDAIARKILAAGGDPSAVQRTIRELVLLEKTKAAIRTVSGNAEAIRQVVLDLIQSEPARRKLSVDRFILQEQAAVTEEDERFDAGVEKASQPPKGLTANSIITLHDALEELDKEFADNSEPECPTALRVKPRRSLHAQIIDLRLLGDCTWEEISSYLDVPLATVHRKGRIAATYLRTKLKGVIATFDELQSLHALGSSSTTIESASQPEG